MTDQLDGIEELRRTIALLNNTREDFNTRFTLEELLQIGRMYRACGWDFTPDTWTARQVKEALKGRVPTWNDNETPTYK